MNAPVSQEELIGMQMRALAKFEQHKGAAPRTPRNQIPVGDRRADRTLRAIRDGIEVTARELAAALEVSRCTTYDYLRPLENDGLVERTYRTNGGPAYFRLTE